jgi:rhodanese-related sulfurtransferase
VRAATAGPRPGRTATAAPAGRGYRRFLRQPTSIALVLVVVAVVVAVAVTALTSAGGNRATASPPSAAQAAVVVQGTGGTWTNVTPDLLAGMLAHKDFVLLNVKTPYVGEIDGTDLYIPYDQLAARASELPASKDAKILVYCRSGVESAAAAQTLVGLGYTNVWNLAGGMNAWQASGRTLVNRNR